MIIKGALKKQLEKLLPKNYRQQVVDRLKARGIEVHPNTVYNVLNGSENNEVALEIMRLYNSVKNSSAELKRLAGAIVNEAA